MSTRCPICYAKFDGVATGDGRRDISPGDQLVDHLTDEHQSVQSKHLSEGVMLDA